MLAAPIDSVPEGSNLVNEPKWDGWRALAFRGSLRRLLAVARRQESDAVLPGHHAGGPYLRPARGSARRGTGRLGARADELRPAATAGHRRPTAAARSREHPAYYVTFDLLVDAGGEPVLDAPLVERRARLVRLLAGAPPQLEVTPQSADLSEVSEWLTTWTAAGVEGVVIKRLDSRYEPGRRGWAQFRARATTEAIIGGVTGSIRNPETALLGRFDRRGGLRYTGRTHPLATPQRLELASLLSPPRPIDRGVAIHSWPDPLPAAWSGQFERPEPLRYAQVEPTVVAEIQVDTAYEHHRWRHRVRYARPRPDLSVYDVPLILGEGEDPFSDHAQIA
ncbi:ATP-dependent DNA ligase [Micromonospora sp. ATA51]|uniref:ATP-dependent DNA ligase n=1 Tax=Micromonospora sp. ATA51 TaxID=2806098 RepID=UPI001EE40BA2|nr:ATP-dependent DNA ligase [Micromonospora sp. ATA51]